MALQILQIRLKTIKYGGWEQLEVGIDVNEADGKKLYLTYPTAETILNYPTDSVRKKIGSKSLKAFLGETRTFGKFSGLIVNKKDLVGATAKVTLMDLDDFLALATWEAVVNQNLEVGQTLASGFGDSLRSLAYDQFEIELQVEDRQAWLKTRLESKRIRRNLTDAVKAYLECHSEVSDNYRTWIYKNVTDAVYRAVFGKDAKKLSEFLECSKDEIRDRLNSFCVSRVEWFEESLCQQIDLDHEPQAAVKRVIEFNSLKPVMPVKQQTA
ncbi:MAG: hypothetical protein SAK29_31770 [Scytonema sp. PMC 1069.18]|nr:hypothetical protein [Scytonema sp. PMC 1069.18]MEC4887093.1 hypothetical protein [Scytonema sp. PMC 1070.18]